MYIDFQTRIQDLVGNAVTDTSAITEWLSEEAVNAINIMSPEMLISASSTHRLLSPEMFNSVGRTLSTNYDATDTSLVLSAGALTTSANCKVGSIICQNQGTTYGSERMRVTAITGSGTKTLKVVRGINGTTASNLISGYGINVVHEKPFNTRKFKLLEVNRDGYSARLINSGLGQQAVDQNSIHYATSKSPVYYVKSGNIYIRPMVSESEQGEIVGLTYPIVKHNMKSTTDLPVEAEDFIVIGAARKYLIRHMYEEFAQLPAGITTTSVPSAPSLSSNQIGALATAPVYTAPKVAGATEELTTTIDAATAGEATDKYDFSRWFDLAADYIEDEEDIELAQAQIQKIGTYINAYSQAMQNQMNVFNDANVEYQAEVQKAVENARLSSQDDVQALQKYQAELQSYSNQLNNKNQIFSSALQRATTKYNWFMTQYDKLTLMYNEKAQILRGVQG